MLVVDEHTALRLGMRAIVGAMAHAVVVGEAADPRSAVEKYRVLAPDVLTMDLRMPGGDGATLIEQVVDLDPDARILVMTMYDGEDDVFRALQAGASGYILKSASSHEIVEAIRTVGRGGRYVPEAIARKLRARTSTPELTPREREVLALIRRGLTNRDIGAALALAPGTVKTHLRQILDKLGAMSRTEAVTIARSRGLLR